MIKLGDWTFVSEIPERHLPNALHHVCSNEPDHTTFDFNVIDYKRCVYCEVPIPEEVIKKFKFLVGNVISQS